MASKHGSIDSVATRAIVRDDRTAYASDGRWAVWAVGDEWFVKHHDTVMFSFKMDNNRNYVVTPINEGWGSRTDKRGTGAILWDLKAILPDGSNARHYNDLFDDGSRSFIPSVRIRYVSI